MREEVYFGYDGVLYADTVRERIKKLREDQKRREERADWILAEIRRLEKELEELMRE